MTDHDCRERVRWLASQAGLEVFFIAPGEFDATPGFGAVFTLEDWDSPLERLDPGQVDEPAIRAAIERARQSLAARCGCEIVHDGAGVFRCLRHDIECDTGEERDPVIRQTLRWTAACPIGGVSQAFCLAGHPPPPNNENQENKENKQN